jgi:quinol-cytochrome oxidoreductase complex cytochrome b subunit
VSEKAPDSKRGVTPLRLVIWILGAAIAVALIATGVVGILTKAR